MPAPVARRAPYKDFLQPALQRRFASTAAIVLLLAYVEAVSWSSLDSFIWSWFPLGRPGIRALTIFASVFPVIILRIAHSHMGIRTSNSSFEAVLSNTLTLSTLETVITYVFSSWVFGQTYLLCLPDDADLHWITRHAGDRTRLNERALFYTVNLLVLGVTKGIMHVALDHNRLLLGTVQRPSKEDSQTSSSDDWAKRLGNWAPLIAMRSGTLAIAVGFANYVFLYHFLRPSAWAWTISIFRRFYHGLPRTNIPPHRAPWSFWMLGRSMWAGFLLNLLWSFADATFKLQLGREPLKKQQPLTSESKDPNGSLLTGLKSKKPRISAFATWELALIARDYDIRRQAIFEDIDRPDGPMWTQVCILCLNMIRAIEQRIDDYGKPATPPPTTETSAAPAQARERAVQPPMSANVWASAPASKYSISKYVTSPGKNPTERIGAEVKRRAGELTEHLVPRTSGTAPDGLFRTWAFKVLNAPVVGPVFQQQFGKRLTKAALGAPYAEISVYVNAAYALSQLAVCSLTEDKYGNVQRDVPTIIRTFTSVIIKLEQFRDGFPVHWTDVRQSRTCEEVEEVLKALKGGLKELITAFGQYSSDLRLSRADMRLAKEAAGWEQDEVARPEMKQLC
ncbi:nucleoporin protein Ndc1-Nup [Xylariomycetidae sp. FL0641]|nr:nucleoporin protein Ndc1-Nup [Xylariomycetidae sp. FL0641]